MKKYISILLIVFVAVLMVWIQTDNNQNFTSEKWKNNIWKREEMIADLIETHDLHKMKYSDILNLLGTDGVVDGSHITYYVGKTFSGPVLFSISFDENEYVRDYGIVVD